MTWPTCTTCNKNRGVDDDYRSLFGTILSAAALAAAGYSAYKAYDIAKQEWDMAKKYWKIARWWLDYYNDNFAPVEDQEIEEALALEYVEPSYDIARGRARATAWIAFKGKLRESMRCTSRYCTGLRNDMLVQVAKAQADAVAAADGLGYRNERAYTESRNDVIFSRKLETAKRGRDMIAEASTLGKSSANIYGDLTDYYYNNMKGSFETLGYLSSREPTFYPKGYLATDGGEVEGSKKYNRQAGELEYYSRERGVHRRGYFDAKGSEWN